MHRESIKSAARIVVKLGTGVLTDSQKQIDPAQLTQLVAQIAALRAGGKEVVLVTSGAVGAGMGALVMKNVRRNSPNFRRAPQSVNRGSWPLTPNFFPNIICASRRFC